MCGHWVSIAKEVAEDVTDTLSEVETLFAKCILPSLMRCSRLINYQDLIQPSTETFILWIALKICFTSKI